MATTRGIMQRIAFAAGILSFLLAVASGVWLYFKVGEVGIQHPVSASLLASIFFFLSVGVVLLIMGTANVPSFNLHRREGSSEP